MIHSPFFDLIHPYTVSIIGLEPTRPGYQAWVHSLVWFGLYCVPRPGRFKTKYLYCILMKSNI